MKVTNLDTAVAKDESASVVDTAAAKDESASVVDTAAAKDESASVVDTAVAKEESASVVDTAAAKDESASAVAKDESDVAKDAYGEHHTAFDIVAVGQQTLIRLNQFMS